MRLRMAREVGLLVMRKKCVNICVLIARGPASSIDVDECRNVENTSTSPTRKKMKHSPFEGDGEGKWKPSWRIFG